MIWNLIGQNQTKVLHLLLKIYKQGECEALKEYREKYNILDKKIEYNKIITKKLSKQEIIKIIKIDNGDRDKDEIKFCRK